ncbi:MAG: HK97 family phage prohead protease, partial [Nitrosopumilus sp.]
MDNTILENFKLDDIVLIPSAADDLELTEHDNGDITISGWFITERFMENRLPKLKVLASAFSVKGAMSEFNGRVLSFHDRMHEPIGKVLNMVVIPGKGVQGTVRIFAENPDLLKRSIREKVLDAFSIGFEIKKYEYDEDKEEMTVTSLVLKELSLVNLGADKNAKFKLILQELAEIYNITELVNTNPNIQPKRSVKLDKNKDQKVDENVKLEEFMEKHEALGVEVAGLKNILTAIKESQADLDDRVITKGEFQTKIEKIATDLDAIAVQVTEAKAAAEDKSSVKPQYKDYRSLITDFIWLTDDEGNKLGKVAQRAHCLFQLPIDYDKMDRGQELQNLRNLHDATLIADAMNRYKSRDRYNIQSLKLFKQLVKATEVFDKDVALAMAGGNTGFGAEWLPSELSSEFNEIL